MQDLWIRITGFGNSALTLLLACAVAAYLALVLKRLRLGAALLLATMGGTAFTLLVLKLAFRVCGGGPVASPSGHAAMSAVVYGCLGLLLSRGSPYRPQILAATAAFVAAIAFSRVELGAHTALEVAIGLAVGSACAAGFGLVLRHEPPGPLRWKPFLPIAALVIAAAYGFNPPVEEIIKMISATIQRAVPVCG